MFCFVLSFCFIVVVDPVFAGLVVLVLLFALLGSTETLLEMDGFQGMP